MRRTGWIVVSAMLVLGALLVSLPFWGMGAAVFLDSRRFIISSRSSPDGRRIADIERLVVGGEPSIVVTVRPLWKTNWYLVSCAAASHYQDARASVTWTSANALRISSDADASYWDLGSAPFHNEPCPDLTVSVVKR